MNRDFWIGELGRLYQRSSEAINDDDTKAVRPLTSQFNENLEELKDAFQDNTIIQGTDKVEPVTEGGSSSSRGMVTFSPSRIREEALHEIRSRCERMANSIGYDLPEQRKETARQNNMVMVSVESNQTTSQEVNQEVTVESIQNTISALPRPPEQKEQLEEIFSEFESELDDEQDESRLRGLIDSAKNISEDVASQMAIIAMKHGLTGVLFA
ncbi:hypothetical protein [Natrinema versiforme]|uniref:Uncharacterized protein n=1 Tax=Natrinema versiforme JCM 10478 TaxID=1227496 RepID=L9XWT8_9EURY|nr:hypothetical protein [Natrinema versiforme]ELY66304.1 hypothetical protein C489_13121 [Natrinema versiforme JCM 10478]